jgi:hypothetical protein
MGRSAKLGLGKEYDVADFDVNIFSAKRAQLSSGAADHAQKWDIFEVLASCAIPCWEEARVWGREMRVIGCRVHTVKEMLWQNLFKQRTARRQRR